MLRNLPARHTTEAAIAAAQLLPHLPSAAEMLSHREAIQALVDAVLEEHLADDIDTIAGGFQLKTSKTPLTQASTGNYCC